MIKSLCFFEKPSFIRAFSNSFFVPDLIDFEISYNLDSKVFNNEQINDKDVIETKTQALAEASSKLAERMYAQDAASADASGAAGTQDTGATADDDVVDAEFEEVDDNK